MGEIGLSVLAQFCATIRKFIKILAGKNEIKKDFVELEIVISKVEKFHCYRSKNN